MLQRPMDDDEQQEYYSGKKKTHTIKNIILIDETCTVRFLSASYAGKWHEKLLVDDEAGLMQDQLEDTHVPPTLY